MLLISYLTYSIAGYFQIIAPLSHILKFSFTILLKEQVSYNRRLSKFLTSPKKYFFLVRQDFMGHLVDEALFRPAPIDKYDARMTKN